MGYSTLLRGALRFDWSGRWWDGHQAAFQKSAHHNTTYRHPHRLPLPIRILAAPAAGSGAGVRAADLRRPEACGNFPAHRGTRVVRPWYPAESGAWAGRCADRGPPRSR
jgi:hypothetical protein